MQTIQNYNIEKNNIFKEDIKFENQLNKLDFSTDYIRSSGNATKLINTNLNSKKPNIIINTPLLINQNTNFNTINEYSEKEYYFSKINLEYDLHISSLKKKLADAKKNRKNIELNVINLKKKIKELQEDEKKSLKQLEYTKKYISNIKKNSIKNLKKNKGLIIARMNKINQYERNSCNMKSEKNKFNNNKKRVIEPSYFEGLTNPNLSHLAFYTAIKNNSINASNENPVSKLINNRKNKIHKNLKEYSSPISTKIYIKKIITSVRKSKNYKIIKDNLIKDIAKDINEKVKIEREIEKINREQNKLYNNFYENFVVLRQAKTLEYDDYI